MASINKSQGSQFKCSVLSCHSRQYYVFPRSIHCPGVFAYYKELYVVGKKKTIKDSLSNVVSGEKNIHLKLQLAKEAV